MNRTDAALWTLTSSPQQERAWRFFVRHCSHVSTLCLLEVTACDRTSQAFPSVFMLQAIKYWRWEQPGYEASNLTWYPGFPRQSFWVPPPPTLWHPTTAGKSEHSCVYIWPVQDKPLIQWILSCDQRYFQSFISCGTIVEMLLCGLHSQD